MIAGIWNFLFGAVLVWAGSTGKYVLPGTSSTEAVMVIGVVMAGWGASQIWRSRRRK